MNTVDLVLRLIDAFENAGVPYMVSGAIAASYYGSPSMTNGAQFVVQISGDQLAAMQRTLGDEFKLDPQMSIDSATMAIRYILEHSPTKFAFDMFLLGPDAHDQARKLDLPYIRQWTDRHGTRASFEQLLKQTQGMP